MFAYNFLRASHEPGDLSSLGPCWIDNKSLILQALPFAITLGILPYVIRIEKFIVAGSMGETLPLYSMSLKCLAGRFSCAASNVAAFLLPILGQWQDDEEKFISSVEKSLDICFGLLPIGLFGGALLIRLLLPVAFPTQYTDGSLGASASDLFMILLVGWCLTLLATPSYTALQAGKNPWIFTTFIAAVVVFATILGFLLIGSLANSTTNGLYGAAITVNSFLRIPTIHVNSSS